VHIDWNGLAVRDAYPRYVPDLYAGRPVLVHGRYDHAGSADVRVSGFIGSTPWSRSVHVVLPDRARDHEALPSVWARARVKDLSRSLLLGETDALKEQIAQLGLTYHLVTAYTSFVAVDESAADAAACARMPITGNSFGYGGLGAAGYDFGGGTGYGSIAVGAIGYKSVLRNIGQVRLCYRTALQRDPTLAGRVTLRFVIGADGIVGDETLFLLKSGATIG
jgi:hypothetical protein